MSQTSPMKTITAAGSATAVVAPILVWLAKLAHVDMPDAVVASFSILLVGGAHWLGNYLESLKSSSTGASQ
jgi:hypothetical protein